MARFHFLGAAMIAAVLLAGCGGPNTGRSTEPNKPGDQQQKKSDDKPKIEHEPG
ncbi:MAG TPA: hypothetical protein VKE94_06460 [Gemmataceae bacterium]|nr:hypothetical protein [Gemmataceae bacterium]